MNQNDDNIKLLYNELKGTYDVGSEDDFRQYLNDAGNREALRQELSSEYDVGDTKAFDDYLGFAQPKPKNNGLLSRMFSPIMEKANSMIESAPKPKPSNKAEDYAFTEAQLESGRSAQAAPQQVTQEEPQQPIDLSRPEEYQIPKPFKKGGEEARELAQNFNNSLWARTQAETNSDLLNPTKDNFAERMASMEMAQQVEAARRMNRGEFDEANAGRFERLYQELVPSALEEEKTKGVERARKEADFFMPGTVGGNIGRAVAYEKHTDPQKIASATIQRVQSNEAFGDYVLSRMGINTNAGNGGESEPLSEEEKKYMQLLFATESGEVADQMIQRIYDQYEAEGAPKSTLDYIAGKAFHENFAASLAKAIVRRAANSSGIREQLRAMASEEYGQNAGWMTRMIGGAAPFAVDMLTGGFAAPTAVGQAVVKGGVGMAAKEVTKEMSKRASARGLKDAALAEAVAGGAGVAERYLATQAPILNLVLRSAGSAANFATYDVQSEAVRQLSEGEFNAGNLVKQAIHGATLGGVLGVTGGMIANATRNSGLTKKVLADIAGVGAETGIFAAANGIEKAQQLGIDITDVDWADTTGEALGMVIGMKGVGTVMHPKTFLQRYRQSKDLGMQLNQRDIDELKAAGYNFDSIFKGLGELGKMAPENATITRRAAEYTIDDSGKRDQRNTETTEAYVDEDAFNAMLSNPEISSSVKRKLTFIATGKVLSLEPVFGASLDVDENGKATITTKNAYGNPIDTKEYDSQEEAEKAYQAVQEMARANTVGGLERIADKVGFQDVKDIAKGRTMNETGTDVDNLDQLSELSSEEANKVLDTYIKNLQDAYMERFNENLKRIGEPNPVTESQGTVGEGGGTPQRTERRQAAYDRGANVAAVDEGQLGTVSYEGKLAEARMMQTMPDGSQQEAIRKQIMQAVEAGDIEAAERIFTQQSPYLSSQQREAVDSYLDAYETGQGIDDFMQQSIEGYEAEQSQWLAQRSDPQGIVTPIILKDGRTVCYLSGDLNGLSAVSSIFVVTEDGENIQISKKDIAEIGQSQPASDILANDVQDYTNWLTTRYNMLADGSMLAENQEADIMIGGQMFHVVSLGQDGQGNTIVQMADGSTMPMAPDQMRDAVDAADFAKIQQLLSEEQQAIVAQQRTERFNAGIVGHAEGTPDLTAKDTKPEVAAEYLLSQVDANGQPVNREQILSQIQREIDQRDEHTEKSLQMIRQADNDMAMSNDGDEEYRRAVLVKNQLEPFIVKMQQERRKWGEIRQAMMTDEERQAFEKDRIKAIGKAKSQSKKDVTPVADATGTVAVPTAKAIVEQYQERSDAEAYVEEQRRKLSQAYKNDVYPKWDDIQKQLSDYQHGLTDMTDTDIKALTDQQAMLEQQMQQMVDAQNAWKKVESEMSRAYTAREKAAMSPHELALSNLAKETDKAKKVKLAREAFKDDADALAVLDNLEPQDVYEFIAANLGAGSINWEGLERGEHHVRGLQEEMGKDKTRGIGAGYDTNGYNYYLAPEGQGKGIDEVIHAIADGSPYDTQEVRNALLGMLSDAKKPTDISHRIVDDRIAQAEQVYEENQERERQAQIDFEDDAIRQATGLEPDEYDAMIADLEQRLAEQEGFENSNDYFKYVEEYEQRENERRVGGGQAQGALAVQGQEGQPARSETEVTQGDDAADGGSVVSILSKMAETYNGVPMSPIEMTMSDQEIIDVLELPSEYLDGATEEDIHHMAEDVRQYFDEHKAIAVYVRYTNKMLFVASKIPVRRAQEAYFHENVHHILESRLKPAEQHLIFNEFWENAPDDSMVTKDYIIRRYDEKDQKEEFFVTWLGKAMADGTVDDLTQYMSESSKQIVDTILNDIHYDRESETAARRQAEEVPAVDTGELPASADSGTNANGRQVKKSSIQGLEDYSEDEIKQLVRDFVQEQVDNANADAEIVDIAIIGSRTTGTAKPDSDLDVLVEYKGKEREDSLFNLFADADEPLVINGIQIDINPITRGKSGTIAQFLERNAGYTKGEELMHIPFAERLAAAKGETNTNPTEEQKKAGNYKMGHVRFGGYRMSIENPKGSTRSGKDTNGTPWSIEMKDTYGYIGQKYGVDGDHLDFFINDDADLDNWNGRVFVVDQKNDDGTFDEHKVMYGYPTWSAARKAYERNYEDGWWDKHVMQMTGLKKEDFDKWLNDSDHKRKPFADYARTKNSDTVQNPMEQLMADVEERKNLATEQSTVTPSFNDGELEAKSIDELKQLRKKKQADKSTAKVLLGTTNIQKGGLKERTLQNNIAQAEADMAAIDQVLEQKKSERKTRIEQQEIGGAMVDQLENMGFDVTADTAEMRRVRKQAEQDKSEEGKLHHMRTSDGQIYGFTYKGKMYLDPRKIDANLPIHEYAHPWCEAFRRLNPEGWNRIVDIMRNDKDTWEFVKTLNPDLKNDDDIAEEMIAKGSGEKGQQYAEAEYARMNQRDPNYKSKWGNIWKNISKAIQDFWKQVGDFLHIKYESAEQVYDQVVRDFANKINPRKRVEQWLKERDDDYLKAVEAGDDAKAKELFDAALRENIGNGMTPYVAVEGYRKMRTLAHDVKSRDPKAIAKVADLMAPLIPKDAVLVPAPSHTGKATDMLDLAQAISERTGAPVADVLTSKERPSQYETKYAGKPIAAKDMGITKSGELPEGKIPVVIDNVVDTGNTAEACVQALGKGIVASLADSVEQRKHVASLKSAEPVVTDKNGNVVPLSERFMFMVEEGNLFSDEDFEESSATVVQMPQIDNHGFNLNSALGKRLAELKKQGGPSALVGYTNDDAYVFVGDSVDAISGKNAEKGERDGMKTATVPARMFDTLSPKLVKDGYKLAFIPDGEPLGTVAMEEPSTKVTGTERSYRVGDKIDVLFNGQKHQIEVLGVEPSGDMLLSIDGLDPVPTPAAIFDEYVRNSEKELANSEPKSAVDKILEEADRRKEEAAAKKEAEKQVQEYVDSLDIDGDKIQQRATKAVLLSMDSAGVPYKVVSKEKERQMTKLFAMMNQEAVKDMARKYRPLATDQPTRNGRYIIYNMNNPFGVPMYFEKMSTAKYGLQGMKNLIPEGDWSIMDIGLPGEEIQDDVLTRRAAELGELMQMMGWHGSGAKFDKFDHRYMSSGEGNQSYGWGTYITEVEGIGRMYAEAMGSRHQPATYKGITSTSIALMSEEEYKKLGAANEAQRNILVRIVGSCNFGYGDPVRMIRVQRENLQEMLERKQAVVEDAKEQLEEEKGKLDEKRLERLNNRIRVNEKIVKETQESLDFVNSLDPKDFKGWSKPNGSYLYKVDIPEETGDNYFDWTKPLPIERAEKILADVRKRLLTDDKYGWKGQEAKLDKQLEAMKNFFGETFYWRVATLLGNSVAGAHRDGHRMTSKLLSKHGYVGVRYPAEYRSGGRDDGATNYVIFNEDDAKITDTIQFMIGDESENGQPMFQKEGKKILGWSDGKQVYLTQAGLNPNTPLHECTHLWDKWCQQEHPELWNRLVKAMKKTEMWKEIAGNPNYRNIWNDENRMASEVHSRLTGAEGEEEFMHAAFNKSTPQKVIDEVKSVLKKFWESLLRLFGKTTKTIGDEWNDLRAIVRMPIRDLVNQDFEKVMRVADAEAQGHVEAHIEDNPDLPDAGSKKIFDAVKKLFGTTHDIREAGYVLPDGSMPDFSGRYKVDKPSIADELRGRRTVDHRDIEQIAYEKDGNTKTGLETTMPEFIRSGAIRIDYEGGNINLATKPTDKQRAALRQLIIHNDGYVQVDFGDGWDSDHYVEYDGAKVARILSDIDRYFDEGIKPQGDEGLLRSKGKKPLLAPNGERSNLDNENYYAVRTDNFKKYFGDWQKANTIVKPVTIDTATAPSNRADALAVLEQKRQEAAKRNKDGKPYFTCKYDGKHIYVSNRDAKHSMGFRNDDQIRLMGVIDELIENAVYLCDEPVRDYDKSDTKAVHIYYGAVEIDGVPHSVRMVVKEYTRGTYEMDEMHLYNGQIRKTTPNAQYAATRGIPVHPSGVVSGYKVRDLIHNTQENDQKIIDSSHVVDENGEPLVVHHGTGSYGFHIFKDKEKWNYDTNQVERTGIFFSSDKDNAMGYEDIEYAEEEGNDNPQEGTYSVFLNIRNPFVVDYDGAWWNGRKFSYEVRDENGKQIQAFLERQAAEDFARQYEQEHGVKPSIVDVQIFSRLKRTDQYVSEAKQKGYDGCIFLNIRDSHVDNHDVLPATTYVAFEPEQIKSATENDGTYDAGNPDIRRSDGGTYSGSDNAQLAAVAEAAGEQLGGVKVKVIDYEHANRKIKSEIVNGTKGIYNPNTGEVTLLVDNIEDADEAVRTVFHEKLGHEGLVALLGSQEAVNKFGTFIFRSAGKTLRQRIMDKADENDGMWEKGDRFSTAAQEVLADIAANGPATEEEFTLWDKVKHYIIRACKAIGLKIRGLLNEKDLRYYILKTGEALKKWNTLDETERQNISTQADSYDIMRSRRGKPRKRNNESDAQYFQRLREWEKWRAAVQRAKDNGDPEPEEQTFHEQAEADFKVDLDEWKARNGIAATTRGVGEYPKRQNGESPQEFAVRIAEWETNNDMWKSAPQLMDYLARANEAYRRAYTEWRMRYDLEEQASVDQRLYEGDIDPTPTFTDADMEAEALAEKDLAEAVGMEVDEAGAKHHAKLAVIERRKNMESSNAEDAIWVYDFVKRTDEIAADIKRRTGEETTGKELRAALPFLIEADRRKENMQAEREDAVMAINMSEAIQQVHTFIDENNLDHIGAEVAELENAWKAKEANPSAETDQAYREAAAWLADRLNALNQDMDGYNKLFADDIMQIRSLLVNAMVAGGGEVMPAFAEKYAGLPEVQQLMEHIKDWYDEFYQVLEDAGLRGDAGYIDAYVNHVWDKEKSDPKAWEQYIENRQRTKSPNMRHREIDTYMDGIEIGLVPKYTDIADMISHYSRQNNEAVANRRFLDDLQFVVVEEMNDAGEVTAVLPLVEFDKPNSFVRERYTQYYVPGVGDIYVLNHIQKRFANIFGTMRTPDAADWLSKLAKGYDLTSSTAKKIQLALSGFHALALFEVDMAQNNPAVALKHLFKYIITDSVKSGTLPAYAHPEDFQLAAKHLVQLGATEDYAAADVNAITQKMRDAFKDWSMSDESWKKAAGTVGSPVAILMDWINKGFDTVLWNYLHDGLKLCAFKELAAQVERRVAKEGLDAATKEQLLDEAGQYVNDMFGGQYWELINVSPATLKWMRRAFLSPDWLISTQRHFFANLGFGSVYSESGFANYIKYNTDNIKRMLGADVPKDELRRLRSKNAKYCYLVGALVWWGLFYNAINALCRWKDEDEEKEKAEEMRKTNPNYKSPYELAYPDGMKWYDYTMYGNTIGQNTHLFTGRYADGTETYVRWGKQFREFPELFIGRHGLEFPAPIIQRMMSKANPNIGTAIDFLGAQNIGGFNGSYENKELREKYGKTIATLAAMSRHFVPFGMPTQTEKEYKWLDFFMPSSKGFSRWKAKDYFETFILDGDWEGIEQTYNACVMNGIDADANIEAAIKSIKAAQRRELSDNATDLSTATMLFDTATDPKDKQTYLNKIKKYLKDGEYKVLTKEEALDKVHAFMDGTDANEKENARYIMLATSDDIIAEEQLKDLGRKARKFKKELETKHNTDEYDALVERYGSWLVIEKKVNKAVRAINKSKKQLGGVNEEEVMQNIRQTIRDTKLQIDELQAPK